MSEIYTCNIVGSVCIYFALFINSVFKHFLLLKNMLLLPIITTLLPLKHVGDGRHF